MAQIDVDIQNLMGIKQDMDRDFDPNYIYNLRGSRVDINSRGACYTMAERVCYNTDVTNYARSSFRAMLQKDGPISAKRALASVMIDMIFVTARTLVRLAALCEMHGVKTSLRSKWMEDNNRRLDVIMSWPDSAGNSHPQYFVEPKDWVKYAQKLNQLGIDLTAALAKNAGFASATKDNLQPITVTDAGSYSGQGTMQGWPLFLAPLFGGTAEAGAAAAAAAGGTSAAAGGAGLMAALLSPPGLTLIVIVLVVGGVWYMCASDAGPAAAARKQNNAADAIDASRAEGQKKVVDEIVDLTNQIQDLEAKAAKETDPEKRKAAHEAADSLRKTITVLQKSVSNKAAERGGFFQSLFGSKFNAEPVMYALIGVTGLLIAMRMYQNRPVRKELPAEVEHEEVVAGQRALEA